MKATIEFNLPEEQQEHLDALHGTKYKNAIDDMFSFLRQLDKHEDLSGEQSVIVERIRQRLIEATVDD